MLMDDGTTIQNSSDWKPISSRSNYKSFESDYAEVAVAMKDKKTFDYAVAVNKSGSLPFMGKGDVINITSFFKGNGIANQTTCFDNECYSITLKACHEILNQSKAKDFDELDDKQSKCQDLAEAFNSALSKPAVQDSLNLAHETNFEKYSATDVGRGSIAEKLFGRGMDKKNLKKVNLKSTSIMSKYIENCRRIFQYNDAQLKRAENGFSGTTPQSGVK